jgi:hypothetical protein
VPTSRATPAAHGRAAAQSGEKLCNRMHHIKAPAELAVCA